MPWRDRLRRALPGLLLALGLLQMVGFACGSRTLRGLGLASAASPLPLVFSHREGQETFAADFSVRIEDAQGGVHEHTVDGDLYRRLGGAYNRRNVYGAAFSHGPSLRSPEARELVDDVLRHGFCGAGPLSRGLGHRVPVEAFTARAVSRSADRAGEGWERRLVCAP